MFKKFISLFYWRKKPSYQDLPNLGSMTETTVIKNSGLPYNTLMVSADLYDIVVKNFKAVIDE